MILDGTKNLLPLRFTKLPPQALQSFSRKQSKETELSLFLRTSTDRPSESIDGIWPSPELYQISVHRAKRAMGSYVILVKIYDFKLFVLSCLFTVRCLFTFTHSFTYGLTDKVGDCEVFQNILL